MIGVFDSGLGGLSVLTAIAQQIPQADLIYFADSAHMPYGSKSNHYVHQRVLKIGEYLASCGCNTIVAACNTATSSAVDALRQALPSSVRIIGIEPGIKPAALSSKTHRIAVLATEITAKSERLAQLIRRHAQNTHVEIVACSGWATRVEALQLSDDEFTAEMRAIITPLIANDIDRIVLGCTHYTFLQAQLLPLCQGRAELVDVADAVARQTARLCGEQRGNGHIYLRASAHSERLRSALPTIGLTELAARIGDCQTVAV